MTNNKISKRYEEYMFSLMVGCMLFLCYDSLISYFELIINIIIAPIYLLLILVNPNNFGVELMINSLSNQKLFNNYACYVTTKFYQHGTLPSKPQLFLDYIKNHIGIRTHLYLQYTTNMGKITENNILSYIFLDKQYDFLNNIWKSFQDCYFTKNNYLNMINSASIQEQLDKNLQSFNNAKLSSYPKTENNYQVGYRALIKLCNINPHGIAFLSLMDVTPTPYTGMGDHIWKSLQKEIKPTYLIREESNYDMEYMGKRYKYLNSEDFSIKNFFRFMYDPQIIVKVSSLQQYIQYLEYKKVSVNLLTQKIINIYLRSVY